MTPSAFTPVMGERLAALLAQFHLPTMATELLPRFAQAGQQEALPLLLEVCELEAADRQARRIARLRAAAKLPPGKTFATFDEKRLPRPLVQQLRTLATGQFLERAGNVLTFGLPGVGKFLVDSIFARDYPVVQGFTLTIAMIFVTVNLLVDFSYAYLDPRVRLS